MRNSVEDTLRHFILETYLPGESPENLKLDTPLLSSGILDSLAVLGVASFVHQIFGVDLDVYETSVEQFDRIADMAAAVQRKLSGPDSSVQLPEAS